jgi:hypothetical protein
MAGSSTLKRTWPGMQNDGASHENSRIHRAFFCLALAAITSSVEAVGRTSCVTIDRERPITVGMSCDEVLAIAGRPATNSGFVPMGG